METYAEWRQRLGMDFMDMGLLGERLIVIATDQFGDNLVCLSPGGGIYNLSSDGNVIYPEEIIDGKTMAQHLYDGLVIGTTYLASG